MSEVRLIDANALLSKMVNEPVKAVDGVDFDTEWFTRIADTAVQFTDMVESAPTVDAVPVCRCKDCKYCYAEGFVNVRNVCEKHYDFGNVDDDWFCADGERTHG